MRRSHFLLTQNAYIILCVAAKRVLVIPDCHFPFVCKRSMGKLLDRLKQHKPDVVIQLGDLLDLFSLSRFPKSQNTIGMTPAEEVAYGRAGAEEMWGYICKKLPRAKKFQLLGNHSNRLNKAIEERLPELCGVIDMKHLWEFDGVETVHDIREELVIDKVCYLHGYRSKLGDQAKYNLMNTCVGHSHRGGVFFTSIKGKTIWELNAGYIADPQSKALGYTKQRWTQWTIGYGLIDELGPRFIPL